MIRVAIADDQELVRAGFASLLSAADDLTIVGEADDGLKAVHLASTAKPDVILMDIRMPVLDGLEATRRIVGNDRLGTVRVIILTTYEIDEYVFDALRAGASGFLTKDVGAAALRDAVRTVADGNALLTPSVTRRVIDAFAKVSPSRDRAARLEVLSARECEVLALVGEGLSNVDIAARLYLSPFTAKTHVSRIMQKLGARDRSQLVVVAFQTGLTTI